jgi:hypothetical protein
MTISSKQGVVAKNVRDLTFNNVKIATSESPVFDLTNARDISIEKATPSKAGKIFLKLQGAASGNVVIGSSDLSGTKEPIQLGNGVRNDAVSIR